MPYFEQEEAEKWTTVKNRGTKIGIVRRPRPSDFSQGRLGALPSYNPESTKNFQVDLRGSDLSALDLITRWDDLIHADFDSKTIWPRKLPTGFDPDRLMEVGKNPGLGVRSLHRQGITGRGTSLAIIDNCLLVDHREYRNRLRFYEEIHYLESAFAHMHGAGVSSIAVGKTVGVAPRASLYYIASMHLKSSQTGFEIDFAPLAESVLRILEINGSLSKENKIRAISLSIGWDPSQKGYREIVAAVEKAVKEDIFVVSSSLEETYQGKFRFHGLGRDPFGNPEIPSSYGPGLFWSKSFYAQREDYLKGHETLLIPMDSRCIVSPTGVNDYVYYPEGGWSWSIPYLAGLYLLACQVKPDITPDVFWREALLTGDVIQVLHEGKSHWLGKIINPVKLIQRLQESSRNYQKDH